MILQKLFINLMIIVSASKTNKPRKRPYDFQNDDQAVKVNEIVVDERSLDFCLKKNKKPKNTFLSSSHHTNQVYPNFKDKECMKRFLSLFDNLYFNTLLLLNSIYNMYGKELINLNEWSELKVIGTNENLFEKYIENFEINDLILLNRNSKINSIILEHFQINLIQISDRNIASYIDIVYMNLLNDLKNENISSLFSSLLIAVKDFGSDEIFGFISLVLLMTSLNMDGINTDLKEFLVYSIAFFWCLALVECRENIDVRVIYSWDFKSKLYKMILKCFCPSSYEIKYKKIFHLLHDGNDQNKWFNEPQVFLLLYFINYNAIPEFFYVYKNLNGVENLTDMTTKILSDEFYKYMDILYDIERILMKNSHILNIKILD